MSLEQFIKKFVNKNAIIKLWTPIRGGHKLITNQGMSACMAWELLEGNVWQNKYRNHPMLYVTSIYDNDFYRDAINIVIREEL